MSIGVGSVFCFKRVPTVSAGLSRTPSHYAFMSVEYDPIDYESYQVTEVLDTHYRVQSVQDPERVIGWFLIVRDGNYYSQINQVNFEPSQLELVDENYTPYQECTDGEVTSPYREYYPPHDTDDLNVGL